MVNFDNDTTVTTAPSDVVKIGILEKRFLASNAIQWYEAKRSKGIPEKDLLGELRPVVKTYFREIQAMLRLRMKKDNAFDLLKERAVAMNSYDDIMAVWDSLEEELYDVGLIKVDKEALGGNLRERNKAQGWYN